MLIEQNIEFEVRGPRPPGRRCTTITLCLHRGFSKSSNTQKFSSEN